MIKIEKIVSKYMDKVGKKLVDNAKLNAPVETGALRDSIQFEKKDDTTIYLGSDLDYALFIELGNQDTTPRAFLRRAVYNRINYKV